MARPEKTPKSHGPMRRSLRWRLQAWHALVLLLVVAGSGVAFHAQARRTWFDEVDAELLANARVLEGVLRAMPPGVDRAGERQAGPGPGREGPPAWPRFGPGPGFWPGPRFGPGWGRGPGPGPGPMLPMGPMLPEGTGPLEERGPRPGRRMRDALTLPPAPEDRQPGGGDEPYFVVWKPDGGLIRAEPPKAADEVPPDDHVGPGLDVHFRTRGFLREVTLLGPGATLILVGRPIGRELGDLRGLALRLTLTGLGVFAAGLAGGWWISARAVRPIARMSETVAGITATSLSRRIDLTDVDTELGDLGALLNTMLGRLEASFDQQVQFTADASHELRTPLAVILSQVELALARPRSADDYREAIEASGRAARRMKRLVDDLLTLARADAGGLELRTGPVDLGAISRECAELLEPLATRRGVRIEVSSSKGELIGDAERLARAVTNLVNNAILYNRPDGRVTLSVVSQDDQVVLKVADTGIGIPEAELSRVFDRFFRIDRARSRASGGSGLGLAICKSIVEAHGGTIEVSSRCGQGTTFTVRLPSGGRLPLQPELWTHELRGTP